MLHAVARRDGRSAAAWLRRAIRLGYMETFGEATPTTATAPTMRGVLEDLTGPAHYTARDIAHRSEVPLEVLIPALESLQRERVVMCVDGKDGDSTWESLHKGREATIDFAQRRGIALDERLFTKHVRRVPQRKGR